MAEIKPLSHADTSDVERLLDAAFGADRHKRTAYLLRKGTQQIDALCFALYDRETLIGSIQCWPVQLSGVDGNGPLIMVGPVAVHPDHQNSGGGYKLMDAMLAVALDMGDPAMMLIGDQEYYGRFGFVSDATGGWKLPGEWEAHRLLCRNPAVHDLPETGMIGPLQ